MGKEKVIQIVLWGNNMVMLSSLGRVAKLMQVENKQGKVTGYKWHLLKEVDFENLRE